MGFRDYGPLFLSFLAVAVTAQNAAPAYFPYDCRRSNVGCGTGGLCNPADGQCVCNASYTGDDCKLATDTEVPCTETLTCENDGKCTTAGTCYCNSDTYGTKCQNPRVNVWCDTNQMFINIYPHGDDNFAGKIFVTTPDYTGRERPACQLKAADTANTELAAGSHTYVRTAQGEVPNLLGYYLVLPHTEPADVSPDAFCTPAIVKADNDSTDYVQNVVVEYNQMIINSLDQVIAFNCSVSTITGPDFTSANAMSVKIFNDDYQKVNATEKIDPVVFEILDVYGNVITSSVNLGDPLDLVFTLRVPAAANDTTGYERFQVKSCTASNSLPEGTEGSSQPFSFLSNSCPAPGSDLLYRGTVMQSSSGVEKTVIPLNAFRFVGSLDQVAFTCQVTLCTPEQVAADPAACRKDPCPADIITAGTDTPTGTGNSTGNATDAGAGGSTGAVNGTDPAAGNGTVTDTTGGTDNTTAPAPSANETTATTAGPSRRKRSTNENEKEVTQTIQVSSGLNTAEQDKTSQVVEKDCIQHSEVIIIIVIFTVILVLMLVVVVALVIRLLRSRTKVMDSSEMSSETQSRYTLPRLSIATTM